MKIPNFPPVVTQALLFGLATALQYVLDNIGVWNISPMYAPVISLAITTVITMIQQAMPKKPEPVAGPEGTPRAMGAPEKQPGYWQRVLVGE